MLRGSPDSAAGRWPTPVRSCSVCCASVAAHPTGSPVVHQPRVQRYSNIGGIMLRAPALMSDLSDCKCAETRAQLRHLSTLARLQRCWQSLDQAQPRLLLHARAICFAAASFPAKLRRLNANEERGCSNAVKRSTGNLHSCVTRARLRRRWQLLD